MAIKIKNLEFTPAAAKAKWDNIEVQGIKEDKDGCCEPIFDTSKEQPDFYSVYLHQITGGVQCIADLPTKKMANDFADTLRNAVLTYKENGYLKKS